MTNSEAEEKEEFLGVMSAVATKEEIGIES